MLWFLLLACPSKPEDAPLVPTSTPKTDSGTDTGKEIADEDEDGDGVLAPEDCDDQDADVYPGATEVCDDGLDNDCDPSTLCRWNGDLGLAPAMLEGLAFDGMLAADLTGDGIDDLTVGISPPGFSTILLFSGSDLDGEAQSEATWTLPGPESMAFFSLRAGDLDGDGQVDLVAAGVNTAWVIPGPLEDGLDIEASGTRITGITTWPTLGVGDFGGDGQEDLALGEATFSPSGRALVLSGPITEDLSTDDATLTVVGQAQPLGQDVSLAADFDGDGLRDLVVAERSNTPYRVFLGTGLPAVLDAADAVTYVSSPNLLDLHEDGALSPFDVDGDGYGDLGAGMPLNAEGAEAGAFVYHGPLLLGAIGWIDASVVFFDGDATGYGLELDLQHDIDGDGHIDAAIAELGENNRVHLFYGPFSGVLDGDAADAYVAAREPSGSWGLSIGDFDADGDGDLSVRYRAVTALSENGIIDTWWGVALMDAPGWFGRGRLARGALVG